MVYSSIAFCLIQPTLVSHQTKTKIESIGFTLMKLTQICERLVDPPCHYDIKLIDPVSADSKIAKHQIFLSGPTSQVLEIQRSLLRQYLHE
ncbi:hypothetical protein K7432_006523, partial [Basidiobolus ranarum]